MKAFHYLLLIAVGALTLHCSSPTGLEIVKNESSDYSIIVETEDSLDLKAARLLQHYIKKVAEVEIPIHNSPQGEKCIYIARIDISDSALVQNEESLHHDAFLISGDKHSIYLKSHHPHAAIYAVSTFLEQYIGVVKYNRKEEYIPSKKTIAVEVSPQLYQPAFDFRLPHFPGRYDADFCQWHKINNLDNWGMFVHTFQHLINPEEYFEEHPEYFALMNGQRTPDAQLCLSNPDVINLLKKKLGDRIAAEPEKEYWSVSQNDYYNYCECEHCQAKYDEYGSVSGIYVEMANALAAAFPDKQISTLAYQFTRSAPKNIEPLDNVNIMFCSIECNRSMPMANDKRSASFVKDLNEWAALTNNIFMWDYVVQFKNYLCPFPNFHVLQPNIQLFHENGVKMMFQQGSGGDWSDWSDLKQYLIAKLLWNPDLNADSLISSYIESYYEAAAPWMQKYFELTQENIGQYQQDIELNIYGYPMSYTESFLQAQFVKQYDALLGSACIAVQDDSLYLKRVWRQKLAVDFALLDIALNANPEGMAFIVRNEDGKPKANQKMLTRLDEFVAHAKICQVENINERSFKPSAYHDYVRRRVEFMCSKNLLQGAEIQSKTTPSPKYDVGGLNAIADGKIGGLKFVYNWMGFEGEDMQLNIDLKSQQAFSTIKMNFLRDNLSWVFLPQSIHIEASNDGKNYQHIAQYKANEIENMVLETSVPFDFEFENTTARYLRISAESVKKCPKWHRGYGGDAWIFVDEILVY